MKLYLRDDIEKIGEDELQELLSRLPQWRRQRALSYRHLSGRRESATAFLLLADALRQEYGISHIPPFTLTEHGKPSLSEYPHIHFSLSHCRNAVLCAIDSRPVGADIERLRTFTPSLLRYTMSPSEQDTILHSPTPQLTFTELWTRKEALLKLTGQGVGSNMHDILLPQRLQDEGITITTHHTDDYAYSIAERVEN